MSLELFLLMLTPLILHVLGQRAPLERSSVCWNNNEFLQEITNETIYLLHKVIMMQIPFYMEMLVQENKI